MDSMKPDPWSFEKKSIEKGFSTVAGIDEAGRGPLAGPVVSAAVILPSSFPISDVKDYKKINTGEKSRSI